MGVKPLFGEPATSLLGVRGTPGFPLVYDRGGSLPPCELPRQTADISDGGLLLGGRDEGVVSPTRLAGHVVEQSGTHVTALTVGMAGRVYSCLHEILICEDDSSKCIHGLQDDNI